MYNFTFYDFLKINRKKTNRSLMWSVVCLQLLTSISLGLNAQNVNIPDVNFKTYLIENPEINTNGDSEISVTEAQSFTGAINCSNMNISDLTGIEAFVNITELDCRGNQLTSLDMNTNTALTIFVCYNINLTAIYT